MKFFSFLVSFLFITLVLSSTLVERQLRSNYFEPNLYALFNNVNIKSFDDFHLPLQILGRISKTLKTDGIIQTIDSKGEIIYYLELIFQKFLQLDVPHHLQFPVVYGLKSFQFDVLWAFIPDVIPVSDIQSLHLAISKYLELTNVDALNNYKQQNGKLISMFDLWKTRDNSCLEITEGANESVPSSPLPCPSLIQSSKVVQPLGKAYDSVTDKAQFRENYLDKNLFALFDKVIVRSLNELLISVELLWRVKRDPSIDVSNVKNDEIKDEILYKLKMICGYLCRAKLSIGKQFSIVQGVKTFNFEVLAAYIPQIVPVQYVDELLSAVSMYLYLFDVEEAFDKNFERNRNLISKIRDLKSKKEYGPESNLDIEQNTKYNPVFTPKPSYRYPQSNFLSSTEEREDEDEGIRFFKTTFGPKEREFPKSDEQTYRDTLSTYRLLNNASENEYVSLKSSMEHISIAKTWEESRAEEEKVIVNYIGLDQDFPFDLKFGKFESLAKLYSYLGSIKIEQDGDSELITKIKLEIRDNLKFTIQLLCEQGKDDELLANTLVELKYEPLAKQLGFPAGPEVLIYPLNESSDKLFRVLESLFGSVYGLIINKYLIFKKELFDLGLEGGDPVDDAYNKFMQEYLKQNVLIFDIIKKERERSLFELENKSSFLFINSDEKLTIEKPYDCLSNRKVSPIAEHQQTETIINKDEGNKLLTTFEDGEDVLEYEVNIEDIDYDPQYDEESSDKYGDSFDYEDDGRNDFFAKDPFTNDYDPAIYEGEGADIEYPIKIQETDHNLENIDNQSNN
jgi:hypothetical protein